MNNKQKIIFTKCYEEITNDHDICPYHNQKLEQKRGKYGIFYGCPTYNKTKCSYTKNNTIRDISNQWKEKFIELLNKNNIIVNGKTKSEKTKSLKMVMKILKLEEPWHKYQRLKKEAGLVYQMNTRPLTKKRSLIQEKICESEIIKK